MKKQIWLIILAIPFFTIAQQQEGIRVDTRNRISNLFDENAQKGTTYEEYLYCTKGYKYQKQSGLDIQKEGYKIEQVGSYYTKDNLKMTFLEMIEEETNFSKCFLIVANENSRTAGYYCLPNRYASQEVVEAANRDMSLANSGRKNFLLYGMNHLINILNRERED